MTVDLLNKEFEKIARPLKSFIVRITASVADAEDIVHDTYLVAQEKLPFFRGESSLKTWLFTIASNLAKDNLRAKKRWPEHTLDVTKAAALSNREFFAEAMHIRTTSPQGKYEIKYHIVFCFSCISKSLPLEQQLCVFLKEIYEFKVNEIGKIMSITDAMVKYYLHSGRSKMIQIFDRRCALINKEGICHQCSELNGIFNPKQNAQEELMKLQLVRDAENSDKSRLFDLRTQIVREVDPFESPAAELQLHHLEQNRKVMENYSEKNIV
jgi:RNA polymerase sigma-70 factor (ECF subfamily)